jgi:ribosome biogenesis GTPase
MDTPGMREIGLESAHVSKAFSDIDELSLMCKFNDCTHAGEPGCAVQEAIQKGTLAADRLSSYRKLQKELKYDNLSSRQIETEKWNEIIDSIGGMKNVRKLIKGKNKGSM